MNVASSMTDIPHILIPSTEDILYHGMFRLAIGLAIPETQKPFAETSEKKRTLAEIPMSLNKDIEIHFQNNSPASIKMRQIVFYHPLIL